jgi:peptide/nickel transport system substrate-binding protein
MRNADEAPRRRTISRRELLGSGATAGALAFAGCTGADSDGGGSDGGDDGDDLSVGLSWDVTAEWTMDEFAGVAPYFTNVFVTLTRPTAELKIEPGLATDWRPVDDQTWEFTLREDVQFHDGTAFDADHVVDRFQSVFDSGSPEWLPLSAGTDVTALDDHTVEFASENPLPSLPEGISHPGSAIPHSDAEKPVGTGPLNVTNVDRGELVETEPFDDYWGDTTDYDSVSFHVAMDNSTRVLQLEDGETEVAFELPWQQVSMLEDRDSIEIDRAVTPIVIYGGINRYREPTNDRELRRALNYAVSQSALIDSVFRGLGKPAKAPISPAVPWSAHEEVRTYDKDPERARELVEQSSYDGEELELLVSTDVVVGGGQLAEALQASFDEVGINVKVRLTERSAFFSEMDHAHVSLLNYGSLSAGADYRIYASWHRNGIANAANYERDGTGLYNVGKDVDELIEKGMTTHSEDRTEYYVEAQKRIVEDGAFLPIAYKEYALGIRSGVAGVDAHPIMQVTDFTEASPE